MLGSPRIVWVVLFACDLSSPAQEPDVAPAPSALTWIEVLPRAGQRFERSGDAIAYWRVAGGRPSWVHPGEALQLVPDLVCTTPIVLPPTGGRVRCRVEVRGLGDLDVNVRGRGAPGSLGKATWEGLDSPNDRLFLEDEFPAVSPGGAISVRCSRGTLELTFLSIRVGWPTIEEGALRGFLQGEWLRLAAALEAGRDRDGRTTTFLTRVVDPATGEVLARRPAGHHPYFDALLERANATGDPVITRRVQTHASQLLRLSLHERTGLPQLWDGEVDRPLPEHPVDPSAAWEFLLHGAEADRLAPEDRDLLRARAERLLETLERAQRADGSWSSRFVPASGEPAPDHPIIRRLRTPLLHARVARFLRRPVDAEPALHSLVSLERTLHWPGTRETPDPGFDDYFGHLVGDALALAGLFPQERAFARFAAEAMQHYAPIWRASQHAGGSCAPDQVRAVMLFLERPESYLDDAWDHWRNLLRTTQLRDGTFADVTSVAFEPRLHMPVGDLPKIPFHLTRLTAALLERASDPVRRAELITVIAHVWIALQGERRAFGYGAGETGATDTARAFVVVSELVAALR